MATITTSQYLDGGTARTAGEAMAIGSGAVLTIRTDTRIHANAPASFTGSLGSPTFTDIGGELSIDATAVRWLAYTNGSGNAPAIGTSITKGSTSGYFLGVWPDFSIHDANVVLALHMDGADNGTTFTDSSGYARTVTATGNAVTKIAIKQFGTASAYFDGTGDYLTVPANANMAPTNNSDFTIDGWIYPTTATSTTYRMIFCHGYGIQVWNRNGTIQASLNDSIDQLSYIATAYGPASSIAQNTWAHFAVVMKDNVLTVYVDGVAGTPVSVEGGLLDLTSTAIQIGCNAALAETYTGYIDDLRYSHSARWSAGFTVPTAAFTDPVPQPIASGSAIPATGYIKLREVTSGPYTAGALTGITATAAGADVPGWIEMAWDAATNFVVGRVGKIKTRGDWFELGTTNGTVGQEMYIPSSSSTGVNNNCPGVWVETASGSGTYEFWPGLASAANMWIKTSLGFPQGSTDARGRFVKTFGRSTVKFGEYARTAATYSTVAGQSSTYAGIALSSTYTWVDGRVRVDTGATAHLFEDGQSVYLDFTSGSATPDGNYAVTVLDAYNFEVTLAGSGTGGNVTVRPGVTITYTTHALNEGEQVYCDFTSGTGVDGAYTIYAVTGANTYNVAYPHSAALTSGNVTVNSQISINTVAAHGHSPGNEVHIDFLAGSGVDGNYTMRSNTAAAIIYINYPWSVAATTQACTLRWVVGHVPPTGCKVRIPNILWSECATTARATNTVPNATIANRPEWNTSTAGAVDLEKIYTISGRSIFAQPYSIHIKDCAFSETLDISECATALDIDNVGVGAYSAQDVRALQLTSNFAGGTVSNVVAQRPTIGVTDHAAEVLYCIGQTFNNLECGIIGYARSTGEPLSITGSNSLTFNGLRTFNGNIPIATSVNITINDLDYNDRFIGRTNATTPYNAITVSTGCTDITIDGVTFGMGNTISDCHPYIGILAPTNATRVKMRNAGSSTTYLQTGIWSPNLYGMGAALPSGGNNNTIKLQKVFLGKLRTALLTTVNSDKNIVVEQVLSKNPWIHSAKAARTETLAWLNADIKGLTTGIEQTTGQTSVYGAHFYSLFRGGVYGSVLLAMNEPTAESTAYYSKTSGTVLFNSSGGVEMRAVGAQAVWETKDWLQGHTGFANITPVMSGGTIGNYTLEYQINTGSGWNGTWKTLNTTNLTSEIVSSSTGFKLKIRITTGAINTTAITYLRIYTTTTTAAQQAINYPLDTNTLVLNGLVSGSDIVVLAAGSETERANVDAISATTYNYIYEIPEAVDICVYKQGYIPFAIRNYTLPTSGGSLPVKQVADRNFNNPV